MTNPQRVQVKVMEPTMMEVWRLSGPGDSRSMWYDRDGRFDPIVPEVETVPMPADPFRLHLGDGWLSAVSSPDLLEVWFPGLTGKLEQMGFVTRKFVVTDWRELPNEVVFDSATATEVPA